MASKKKEAPEKEDRRAKKGTVQIYTVKEPTTVLSYIQQVHSGKSRNAVKSMLTHRQIAVNGVAAIADSTPLLAGDVVTINTGITPEPLKHPLLKIVFEDDYLVVVDKKSGLLSVGTDKEKEQTAYAILKGYLKSVDVRNKVFILHRLDRDTSGVMMFAKSLEIQEKMQRSWNDTVTDRRYIMVTSGRMDKSEGQITTWLTKTDNFDVKSSFTPNGGQRSTTYFRVLKSSSAYSLVEATLDSGRKNQIRVHMKDLGFPIVGDKKYGGVRSPFERLGLHAFSLEFIHPVTGKKLRFESKIPRKFTDLF